MTVGRRRYGLCAGWLTKSFVTSVVLDALGADPGVSIACFRSRICTPENATISDMNIIGAANPACVLGEFFIDVLHWLRT